jgi:hypothetical protein
MKTISFYLIWSENIRRHHAITLHVLTRYLWTGDFLISLRSIEIPIPNPKQGITKGSSIAAFKIVSFSP